MKPGRSAPSLPEPDPEPPSTLPGGRRCVTYAPSPAARGQAPVPERGPSLRPRGDDEGVPGLRGGAQPGVDGALMRGTGGLLSVSSSFVRTVRTVRTVRPNEGHRDPVSFPFGRRCGGGGTC